VAAVPPRALPSPLQRALRDIYFEFDQWGLTRRARGTLEELAAAMKDFPRFTLRIEGHADERGTPEYNLALGERRAQAARDYLVNLGVDAARIESVSYGEERPLDPGRGEIAWTLNRRAHFVVTTQ
jgi:peptidoglycan-associated lipoprotein